MTDDFFTGDPFKGPPCKRCDGKGEVLFRYGIPGQDRHLPYSEVVWDGAGTWKKCPVCKGSGEGKHRYSGIDGLLITFDEFGAPHRTPLKEWRTDERTTQADQ